MNVEQCDLTITELSKFCDHLVYLGPYITDNRLELFERQIGFILASDFKYILKQHNGLSLDGTEVYGIDKALRGSSLDELYKFEHFQAHNPMPLYFLPFSPDGRGNHYCLDLSDIKNGICPVAFWQHDFYYESFNDVERCNVSFTDWINEVMIDSALGDYNYDGSKKNKD